MTNLAESTEHTAVITIGSELARTHETKALWWALSSNLALGGRWMLQGLISRSFESEATGPHFRTGYFSPPLVERLRLEGRGELADTVVSLLRVNIDVNPVLWLDDCRGTVAWLRDAAARDRARGDHTTADHVEGNVSNFMRGPLVERLKADGHHDLANAILHASWEFSRRERGEKEAPAKQPTPPARPYVPPPEYLAFVEFTRVLGRAHSADVLGYALITKLRAEGRDMLAGSIMAFWARFTVGPLLNPAALAAELIAQLRVEGRGELADTIASLLSGVSIERDPEELIALWRTELAKPMVDSGPIAVALVTALRKEKDTKELGDALEALMSAGQ